MSREKQIAKMAQVIRKEMWADDESCRKDCEGCDCFEYRKAEILYNAGYRKQSENVTDINDGRKSEWISVDERLPTWEDGKVLAFTKYGFSVCERTVNSRWRGEHACWVTHWMPLPEAPKMKGGERE